MRIKILFIQRKCSYEGEYAPEALAMVDEYTDDENPDYFINECKTQLEKVGDEIASQRVLEISISDKAIDEALASVVKAPAKIIDEPGEPSLLDNLTAIVPSLEFLAASTAGSIGQDLRYRLGLLQKSIDMLKNSQPPSF